MMGINHFVKKCIFRGEPVILHAVWTLKKKANKTSTGIDIFFFFLPDPQRGPMLQCTAINLAK